MANQNLSQFGEKLFVADADHTFIWDTQNAISKRVSRNSWLNSGTLTSDAPVTISQTWNAGTNVMTAFKVVATDTMSGATSNLLELWAGSTPILRFNVGKNGTVAFRSGNVFGDIATDGVGRVLLNASSGNGARVTGDLHIGSANVVLLRDGADNTLALRNGAAAQTFNVYGTYTSITDYRRLTISCDNTTGNATITANKGSGTTGNVGLVFINGLAVGVRGTYGIAIGENALPIVSGTQNLGVGFNALQSLTSGTFNCAVGNNTLTAVTTGGNNIAFGSAAGVTAGNSTNSVFLGTDTKALGAGQTNQIVIGYDATGIGSNSVVLGNDSITKTALKGNVGIGTTAPRTKLHLQDTTLPPLTEFSGVAIPDYTGVGFQIQIGNNTNARIGQASTTHGGLLALGFTANTNVVSALSFVGYLGSTSPTVSAVTFVSQKHNGTTGRTDLAATEISSQWLNGSTPLMTLLGGGNVGIGTTSPTSKLHVAGSSSPTITVENTLATGYSQFLFKNTAVTGDGFWLNGSAQSGYGGPSSFNLFASSGPMAFHTASVTNALSIAQSGVATFGNGLAVGATHASSLADFIASGSLVLGSSVPQVILNSTNSAQESRFASGGNGFFFDVAGHATASNNDAIFRTGQTNASYNLTEVFRITYNGLITFGGLANTVPAIKRSTVRLQARLADDSAFTNIQGKLTTDTDYTAGSIVPTGFLTLYDAQGNAYKVPCVAA